MTVHHFQPTRYYRTISSHPPVLQVKTGDTIVTSTVDASGRDASGEQVTPRGNPQTGPFYVEGAEPGDTLAVALDRLAPNRDSGWSGSVLAENVLDPAAVRDLPPQAVVDWIIDRKAGTTRLANARTGLRKLTLPIVPMLGCFGVAPPEDQAISTATSSAHGGNMDYRGFVQGVTVYFPVFVPGALLHIGDGHALQGDGEIAGTGIETSFDVQITVRVEKGKRIEWPRGENATHIFTVGNARPLDQALQHATTEMLTWLQSDHGLDATSACTLLGQCVEYDVGNVFDPAYTMVCKLRKDILAQI